MTNTDTIAMPLIPERIRPYCHNDEISRIFCNLMHNSDLSIMDHLLEVHINIKGKTQSTFIKKADESAYSAIIAKDVVK
jgi:3'-phosphoadenosine 5'-phosphosulfate (PAPS) 3'-phosphatase